MHIVTEFLSFVGILFSTSSEAVCELTQSIGSYGSVMFQFEIVECSQSMPYMKDWNPTLKGNVISNLLEYHHPVGVCNALPVSDGLYCFAPFNTPTLFP